MLRALDGFSPDFMSDGHRQRRRRKNFVADNLAVVEKIVASTIENCKNFVAEPLIIGLRYGKILVKARMRRSVYAVSKGL